MNNSKQKISKKIIQALPIIAAFASITGLNLGFIYASFENFRGYFLVFLLLLLPVLIYLYFKARASFGSPARLPYPQKLWRFIFNQIPSGYGHSSEATQKVLLIFDENTQDYATKISSKFQTRDIIYFKYNASKTTSQDELRESAYQSDAIYMFWTDQIESTPYIYGTIIKWAVENSQKPVLVVNMLSQGTPYEIPFNFVGEKDAVDGIWRLFARSNERANAWRKQAKLVWNGAILAGIFLLIVIGGLIWQNSHTNRELDELKLAYENSHSINLNSFKTLNNLLSSTKYFFPIKIEIDRKNLKQNFHYLLKEWLNSLEENLGISNSELSIWREENNTIVKKFCTRHIKEETEWPNDTNSIIGSAFNNKDVLILWKGKPKDNEPMAWNIYTNQAVGFWNRSKEAIVIDEKECRYGTREKGKDYTRKALVCLSLTNWHQGQNSVEEYGLCLDFEKDKIPGEYIISNHLKSNLSSLSILVNFFCRAEIF